MGLQRAEPTKLQDVRLVKRLAKTTPGTPADHGTAASQDLGVSVVIPCRNEAPYIRQVIDSVFQAERPTGGMEVIVVDGMSDDGTREILAELATKYGSDLNVLDNPARLVSPALNQGIRASRGAIIIRLDAHSYCDRDYFTKCVHWLHQSGADNVGGITVCEPSENTVAARALAQASSHPFGAGDAHYRAGVVSKPRYVDTVPFGCFRRELFDEVGLFREDLDRSEDMEFNTRLRRNGGKVLLVPEIRSRYQVRGTLRQIIPHYFRSGFGSIAPWKVGVAAAKFRHVVPMIFVASMLLLALLAPFFGWAAWTLFAAIVAYGSCSLLSAVHVALKGRRVEYLVTMPLAFALLHTVYGAGSLCALGRLATGRVSKGTQPRADSSNPGRDAPAEAP